MTDRNLADKHNQVEITTNTNNMMISIRAFTLSKMTNVLGDTAPSKELFVTTLIKRGRMSIDDYSRNGRSTSATKVQI